MGRILFPLKNYDKRIVQNMLIHMAITKNLCFRLVPRSEVRKFSLTFQFKSNESHQKCFKNLNLEKTLRLKNIIVIFSLPIKLMKHTLR